MSTISDFILLKSKDFKAWDRFVTISISDVDKIKADDVISGVAISGGSLVQAVDVESGCEYGPYAQNLIKKIKTVFYHSLN